MAAGQPAAVVEELSSRAAAALQEEEVAAQEEREAAGKADTDDEESYLRDHELEPSTHAAAKQRAADWAARASWGPQPEASLQELAAALATYLRGGQQRMRAGG